MCGNRAYCWKTVLTSRRYGGTPTASRPPITISPSSGCSKPAIIRSDVVLPQPDGPRSDRNSPLRTFRLTPFTAVSEPNRLVTARNSTSYASSSAELTQGHPLNDHLGGKCRAWVTGRPWGALNAICVLERPVTCGFQQCVGTRRLCPT